MRITLWLCLLLPLTLAAGLAQDQGWNCQTPECIGHKAGYEWAVARPVTDEDCNTAGEHYNSPSFAEGCKTAVIAKQRFEEARRTLTPILQAYALGQRLAKEGRSLPTDCQSAYDSMISSDASIKVDTLLAMEFRDGCLEVAKKQAKRIIKENEKRAKEAAKQAKKQAPLDPH
jgi:hypothetical protein